MTSTVLQTQSTPGHEGELWSARPTDWAEVQEAQCRKLFEAVLLSSCAKADARMLDMGCGSGMFCEMAAARGVRASGVDAAAALVEIARQRTPGADVRVGDMEALPFGDSTFDSAVAINSLQFTPDPGKALSEAHRVVSPGGTLVIATWGMRGDCEAAPVLASIVLLTGPTSLPATGPFALSRAGALESLAAGAGWQPVRIEHVVCEWRYDDIDTALRGLLSTAEARRAATRVGEERLREVVSDALDPFRRLDGSYSMHNAFRYLIAEK